MRRVGQCLYRSQQSGVYYAILKRGGKQIKRSLKTTDQALAKRRLAEMSDRASTLAHGGDSAICFADLGEKWVKSISSHLKTSSATRQAVILRGLGQFFGATQVRRITRSMVEDWAAIRSKTAAARTFNYERETLRRVLDYAIHDGLMLDNPVLTVKRRKAPRHEIVIPTREQFRTLIETIRALRADAGPAADLCELLAYSGCRLGEAITLKWGNVNFEMKRFTVTGGDTGTKNHEVRFVPLFPALEALLIRFRDSRAVSPLDGERIAEIQSGKKAMITACLKAGLQNFTHHSLRHFFCSNAIEAGVDFKAIASWVGHKDGGLLVAKTYGHLRDEHSALMAQRMTFGAV